MRLIRLHVENFGKLQGFDYSFDGGLNVLLQENGWGKSTLAAFVKAILYGMPASSKQSLDENERKKYMPWQGGAYGGSLEFSTASGKYRIERFFGAKESGDSFVLYDLATNCESNRYSSRIGEELFGIDADGFSRTVYLSQHAVVAKGDNNSITAKLGDLLDDVDDIGSFDDAMAALEKRRKYYKMTGERGRIADIEREIANARAQIEQLFRTEEMMHQKESELAAIGQRAKEVSAASTGAILTAEEHNIIGGLGSAVAEVVCESKPVPVVRVGVEDKFGRSGSVSAMLEAYGITPANIAAKAKLAVSLKKA